ncbi:hypothetical protein TSAR_009662 [Trichomalopsis sarcophagae]|uniref:HAT C-terminal dimerisation domain-containing protein n=1 Tax=Trichomalopsis sarcophagae TaxID=543379 RepID=A0A232ELP5_9HYME|nr:hypothetical protein TSAR_009662 [Trichomalopsis sarcophagae]
MSKDMTTNNLQINWSYEAFTIDKPLQKDAYNCGVFVMYYMDCIGNEKQFDMNFDPQVYRKEVAKLLIRESQCMKDVCLYCFSQRRTETIFCISCQRFAHVRCLLQGRAVNPTYTTSETCKLTKINEEWRFIIEYKFPEKILNKLKTAEQCDDFCFILNDYIDENGKKLFQNVSNFALSVLCIPNANAAPERLWSVQGFIKTKLRNKLSFEVLRAILLAGQYVNDMGGVSKFVLTDDMIESMKKLRTEKIKSRSKSNTVQQSEYNNVSLSTKLKEACNV